MADNNNNNEEEETEEQRLIRLAREAKEKGDEAASDSRVERDDSKVTATLPESGREVEINSKDPFKIDRGDAPTGRGGDATLAQDALLGAEGIYDTARLAGNEGRILGSKPVQKVAGFADKLNKIKAPQIVGNLAKGSRLAQAGSLLTPAGLYTAADLITGAVRDDGRGLSEMGGNALGGLIGRAVYGGGDGYGDNEGMRTLSEENERREAAGEAAMSAPESVSFLNSMNPNQFDATNARLDSQEGVAPQSVQQAQANQSAQGGQAPNIQQALAPSGPLPFNGGAAPQGNIIGSYQAPDGQNIGMFQNQPNAPITQQQLDSLAGQMVESGAPFISGGLTNENGGTIPGAAGRPEGMRPFIDQSGNVAFADPETASSMNALAGQKLQGNRSAYERAIQNVAARSGQIPQEPEQGSPQANFLERMKSGAEITKDEISQAEELAKGMNTTFNAETGYSRDSFLKSRESPKDTSSRDAAGSAFSQASLDREARLDARPDFNDAASDRDRRKARGEGTSMADLRDMAKFNDRYSSNGEIGRAMKVAEANGINILTGNKIADEEDDRKRQIDFDNARIDSLKKEDPSKFEEAELQADALLEGYTGQDGSGMTDKEKDDLRREMIFKFLLPNADFLDNPFSAKTPNTP
jgi:hypothetical protein